MKWKASAEEVARAVLFLGFDATFTTGAALPVDGGLSQVQEFGTRERWRKKQMSVRHFTAKDADWYQYDDQQIFVGDVLDSSNSETMSVGFYRNLLKGHRNEWIVTYDEALICTRGAVTVRSVEGAKTAKAGEVIFLTKGTSVAYEAAEDDTEVVYVTYPHWMDAQRQSEHAALLDAYHPVTRHPKGDLS